MGIKTAVRCGILGEWVLRRMQPSYTAEDGMRTHAVEGYGVLSKYRNVTNAH